MACALSWWPADRWPENKPDSLLDLCLDCLVANPEVFLDYDDENEVYSLKPGVTLPHQICEQLLELWHEAYGISADAEVKTDKMFLNVFQDTEQTKLKHLNLTDFFIEDAIFEWLMRHKPREVIIDRCRYLTYQSLDVIQRNSENLVGLFIGDQSELFVEVEKGEDGEDESVKSQPEPLFDLPRLQALSIHGLGMDDGDVFPSLTLTLKNLARTLVHLDLSECELHYKPCVKSLGQLTHLTSLVLYDFNLVNIEPSVLFDQIKQLRNLRLLDLSQGKEQPVMYEQPETTLRGIVQCLPELIHLDLSGTNLAGFLKPKPTPRLHKTMSQKDDPECAIPGLEGRHLEFLGLLNCPYEACQREDIPANQVSGDANERQVILSVQKYYNKCDLLLRALNSLFQFCRYSECTNQRVALHAILRAMRKHPLRKTIQISGSASLFYICKSDDKQNFSSKVRRIIIRTLLDSMENHCEETTMLRNGCLTLCHFKIPQDVLFDYERVVRLLLDIVRPPEQEEFVQHVGIFLLNSLACQVDGHEKQLVGDLGAIETMLSIIEVHLSRGLCDEVMEIAWSTMWNVTDETAVNCERFIDGDGMELFLKCLQKFPDKDELLRNMMGLLGNVAEVESLRPRLMQSEYVAIFSQLLDSSSDGIEVSYNACGVLAHLVSDGPWSWTCSSPSRAHVLQKMISAISRWKLNTKRNINYRSFEPILRLLSKFDTPEAQHWATWALCNLTRVYRKKYCALVEKEQGVPLLEQITNDPRPLPETKSLAYHVIQRCRTYRDYTDSEEGEEDGAGGVQAMEDDDND